MSTKTLDILRRLVAERPQDFETRLHLAELLIADKLDDEALGILEQALVLRPEDPIALRIYAKLCYERHSFEEARHRLETALRKGPPDPKSDMLLSRVYLQLGDLERAREFYRLAVNRDPELEDASYLSLIMEGKSPTVTPTIFGVETPIEEYESEQTRLTFSDVGGMEELKEYLRMNIILPLKKPDLFRRYGKRVGGGLLMFGPPGCGKTYIARALAGECNTAFYKVGIHEILDKYFGESEKNMHRLFELARRNAPSIILLDEIDALAHKRASDSFGRALRGTVDTLLMEMDRLGELEKLVLVIGATNTPWSVDPALRRPGRFDRVVFVPPPDQQARVEILKLHLRSKPAANVDYQKIASRFDKFSGADIHAVVDEAIQRAIKRAMKTEKIELITTTDLLEAAKQIRPSTLEWLATASDYARYSNESGIYDQVKAYLDNNP